MEKLKLKNKGYEITFVYQFVKEDRKSSIPKVILHSTLEKKASSLNMHSSTYLSKQNLTGTTIRNNATIVRNFFTQADIVVSRHAA